MYSDRFLSPLRYPGGKGRLAEYVASVVAAQPDAPCRYVEPFAGGAAVALHLLVGEYVDEIVINDLDPGVAAFWRALFDHTDELVERTVETPATIDTWHKQRAAYLAGTGNDVELGFATFFLNRTNRSGILGARPIGGLDQTGKWGIDARYDAAQLVARVRRLAAYRSRVTVLERDGIDVAAAYLHDAEAFLYVDPPYLEKADDLYLDTLTMADHRRLANVLATGARWLLTYDKNPKVLRLYPGLRCASFGLSHNAAIQHIGTEYAVFADGVVIPGVDSLGRAGGAYVRGRRDLAG